jgi:hypothetical protein
MISHPRLDEDLAVLFGLEQRLVAGHEAPIGVLAGTDATAANEGGDVEF